MRNKPWLKWVLIGGGGLVVAVVAGFLIWFNFIKEDAAPRLSLDDLPTQTTAAGSTESTVGDDASIDGTYSVGAGSQAGYRAKEVLFGLDAEAAARTDQVTGSAEMTGTTISTAEFTVDMASVKSDPPEERRDNQYRTRIMDVETFPTSTFTLTSPIEIDAIPAVDEEINVSATGDFTLRGVTKSVTFDMAARRQGPDTIGVQGSIPIVWSEWEIPEPSFGPAQVEGDGEIEFLLVLTR